MTYTKVMSHTAACGQPQTIKGRITVPRTLLYGGWGGEGGDILTIRDGVIVVEGSVLDTPPVWASLQGFQRLPSSKRRALLLLLID